MKDAMTSAKHAVGLLGIIGLSLVTAAGCSGGESDEGEGGAGSTARAAPIVASATYDLRTDVGTLSAAEWDALVLPNDGTALWLKPEARDREMLRPGAVTVIKGRGVLKAGSVTDAGDHLVVEKLPFGLGDFMENGDVDISGAVPFDQPFADGPGELGVIDNGPLEDAPPEPPAPEPPPEQGAPAGPSPQSLRPLGDPLAPPLPGEDGHVPAGTSASVGATLYTTASKFLADGWTMSKDVKGDRDHLTYDIVMTKDSGGFIARLHAKGTLTNLEALFKAKVQSRSTTQSTLAVKAKGEADLSWEIGIKDNTVSYNKVMLPGLTYRMPFFLGEIPMVLRVQTGFVLLLAASGRNSTSTGTVHVKWDTDGGMRITPGAGAPTGKGDGDATFNEDHGTLAVGVSGFGIIATLPRVDIGVGIDRLFVAGGYYKNTATAIVKSPGALAASPCSEVETTLEGRLGLMLEAGSGSKLALAALGLTENELSSKVYGVTKTWPTCGVR